MKKIIKMLFHNLIGNIRAISFLIFILYPIWANSQNEKFDSFLNKFASDSVFQVSRISFPLQYVSWDWDNDKEVVTEIKKEKYKYDILYFSLEECTDVFTIFYDNFDCKFRETDEMVFRWKGFTSVDRRYYFKRLNGIWILIKIVDYDPINNDGIDCLSKTDWDGVGAMTNR